jgi:hypothetical protein
VVAARRHRPIHPADSLDVDPSALNDPSAAGRAAAVAAAADPFPWLLRLSTVLTVVGVLWSCGFFCYSTYREDALTTPLPPACARATRAVLWLFLLGGVVGSAAYLLAAALVYGRDHPAHWHGMRYQRRPLPLSSGPSLLVMHSDLGREALFYGLYATTLFVAAVAGLVAERRWRPECCHLRAGAGDDDDQPSPDTAAGADAEPVRSVSRSRDDVRVRRGGDVEH